VTVRLTSDIIVLVVLLKNPTPEYCKLFFDMNFDEFDR